ncbi:hypothetical protein [Aromatoleum toluclasticum]|uniref:hypothetical protein n=1 Tax=Aromatoleum toluclasticum TaxID=92003 RepID=UPI0003714E16|nr:hypothetical protein [Aromatoleum toluclasticum]
MPRLDDLLIHQNYGTLDNIVESDPRWFDRFYFNLQAIDGSLSIAQGIGVYPNMKVSDGFACIATPELQVNVRSSRELVGGDRDVMAVGPLHAEVVEPMKRWRFWLDDNPYGARYEFDYVANFEAMEPMRLVSEVKGRKVWDWTHFGHVGRVEGWVELDSRRIALTPDRHYAVRDRSWGVRPGIAVIEDMTEWFRQANWGTRHNWVCVQLDSFYLWYFQTQEQDGTPRFFEGLVRWSDAKGGAQEKVTHIVRRFELGPNEHFEGCAVDVHLASGRVLPVKMRRLPTCVHLRGGNYGGKDGVIHGMRQGPLKVTGERWEPADSRLNPASMGLQDHVVEVSCEGETGCGIFELSYGT